MSARATRLLLYSMLSLAQPVHAVPRISAVWANTGEDKVLRDELRASRGASVTSSVWDGTQITLFGARNEVVAFNLILEAADYAASHLTVSFDTLTNASGATMTSSPATGEGVFDWTHRPIELFYVRYLQIKGLSIVANDVYDERIIPSKMRRPWSGNGTGMGTWRDRPGHDQFFPEIAVPLEAVPEFSVPAGTNQSIWVDVYIPRTAPPGIYLGNLVVRQAGALIAQIPVRLRVYNFSLPDTPAVKTMLSFSPADVNRRYFGATYVEPAGAAGARARLIRDRHFQLAHRHLISLIGDDPANDCNSTADRPCPEWVPRLDGSLFTSVNGYEGPGANVGNGVYSIGTYGAWSWNKGTEADMRTHTDAWETWFSQNAARAERFLYLIDESPNTAQIETWSQWILNNPGPGRDLRALATIDLRIAAAQVPSLNIPASTFNVGVTSEWETLVSGYLSDPRKRFYLYNGHRPGSGSFAIEDDGVALRELAWGQYKKRIPRWFFWESTYYNNFQGGGGDTNVFRTARTMGQSTRVDPVIGETGWSYGNGDGVLFYPGTDQVFPSDSYDLAGPIASLRLKYWRRGIQDAAYLTLAAGIDPQAVQTILNQIVPRVLWEYGVTDPQDPTFVHTDISWSSDPEVWETARAQLADILPGGTGTGGGGLPVPTLNLPSVLPVDAEIAAGYPSGYNIAAFQWSIVPSHNLGAIHSTTGLAAGDGSPGTQASSPNPVARLGDMSLSPGKYQISVVAVDTNNQISPSAHARVTLVASGLSDVKVFPNPWRSDRHTNRRVTFDNLPGDTSIKIFTVSGHFVKALPDSSSFAVWDLTNESGDFVASGIYVYLMTTRDGQKHTGQIVIIK